MNNNLLINEEFKSVYKEVKILIENSRNKVYNTVNTEMLNLHWSIGKILINIQKGKNRSNYGDLLLEKLSKKLTKEFYKGFIDEVNSKYSIISVGKNNRYGHTNDSVLDNLEDSKIHRGDQDGSVILKIENYKFEIETYTP